MHEGAPRHEETLESIPQEGMGENVSVAELFAGAEEGFPVIPSEVHAETMEDLRDALGLSEQEIIRRLTESQE